MINFFQAELPFLQYIAFCKSVSHNFVRKCFTYVYRLGMNNKKWAVAQRGTSGGALGNSNIFITFGGPKPFPAQADAALLHSGGSEV
jgi:hypothetical protein